MKLLKRKMQRLVGSKSHEPCELYENHGRIFWKAFWRVKFLETRNRLVLFVKNIFSKSVVHVSEHE